MITARAPRAAVSTAIARPRPVEPPVTTTTNPSKSLPAMFVSQGLIFVGGTDSAARRACPEGRGGLHRLAMTDLNVTQLGQTVSAPERPEDAVLERVPNPQSDTLFTARFVAPEFTSVCPVTGQPDFAHLVIDYAPAEWLIESKSLKLYLTSFRNLGAFHEDCTVAIGRKIVEVAQPRWLRIGGYWYPRGGIPIDVFWQTGPAPEGLWVPDQGVPPYRGRG